MTSELDPAQQSTTSATIAEKKLVAVLGLTLLFCTALVEWATAHYALPRPAWALWLQIVSAAVWLIALPRVRSARTLTIGTGALCAVMALGFAVFLLTLKQS